MSHFSAYDIQYFIIKALFLPFCGKWAINEWGMGNAFPGLAPITQLWGVSRYSVWAGCGWCCSIYECCVKGLESHCISPHPIPCFSLRLHQVVPTSPECSAVPCRTRLCHPMGDGAGFCKHGRRRCWVSEMAVAVRWAKHLFSWGFSLTVVEKILKNCLNKYLHDTVTQNGFKGAFMICQVNNLHF